MTGGFLSSFSFSTTRLGLTVSQALLQGRPVAANLANLHQRQLDTAMSEFELHGYAEALVAEVRSRLHLPDDPR